MHLIYIDESGNTGMNLNDQQQPVLALTAMIVNETSWQKLESDLANELDTRFSNWRDRQV